jgi:dienelactone hydrolase
VADVSFVIYQVSNATAIAELLPRHGHRKFPTDRVAMLGHSLSGITAVSAARQDLPVRGVINWDSNIFNSLPPSGLSKPVLYMPEAKATNPTWLVLWPLLKEPKPWVEVANTTYYGMSHKFC